MCVAKLDVDSVRKSIDVCKVCMVCMLVHSVVCMFGSANLTQPRAAPPCPPHARSPDASASASAA